jgi:hypothetical protein
MFSNNLQSASVDNFIFDNLKYTVSGEISMGPLFIAQGVEINALWPDRTTIKPTDCRIEFNAGFRYKIFEMGYKYDHKLIDMGSIHTEYSKYYDTHELYLALKIKGTSY